jgi:hypothetical protein
VTGLGAVCARPPDAVQRAENCARRSHRLRDRSSTGGRR